tara:strand:+ start:257 stop:634 length:378 start_codon:yes stop_codon:yes gene_type:complete
MPKKKYPTKSRSHRRAILKHKMTRKRKRKTEIKKRRWRNPRTGSPDKFTKMQAKARSSVINIHNWLVSLGVKHNWKISPKRQFEIGSKVDELTTLLGKMSVKKSQATARGLSKYFDKMSIKRSQQ